MILNLNEAKLITYVLSKLLPEVFAHFILQKELPFRSRSTSPSRSPSRRRSRSPGRRSRSRSRSPARSRGRPPAKKTSEESLVEKITQQTAVTPTRRSPRRGRMPEKEVEETSTTTTTVTKDSSSMSSSVTTLRVTRSVTKKLIAEEKEALLTAEIKPTMTKSRHGYEFGGPFGVLCMMIALPAVVVSSYLFCSGTEPCSIRRLPSIPPLWRFTGGFFDIGHLIVDGWIILQALIYMLPVGTVCIFLLYTVCYLIFAWKLCNLTCTCKAPENLNPHKLPLDLVHCNFGSQLYICRLFYVLTSYMDGHFWCNWKYCNMLDIVWKLFLKPICFCLSEFLVASVHSSNDEGGEKPMKILEDKKWLAWGKFFLSSDVLFSALQGKEKIKKYSVHVKKSTVYM